MNNPKVVILNADPSTSNRGVSALFATAVSGIARRLPTAEIIVVDSCLGHRKAEVCVDGGDPIPIKIIGTRTGRRFHRPENLWTMSFLQRFGWLGRAYSPFLKALAQADIAVDVSGGDSFTNLYGPARWSWTVLPKRLALASGVPLLMLPKTYGPFDEGRQEASLLVRRSIACWARDGRSFEVLKELLGDEFDPARHREGVDMAFALEPRRPNHVVEFLDERAGVGSDVIGLNVSGLMYNDPDAAREKYGFVADYDKIVDEFLRWIMEETEARVVLVPHVMAPPPSVESDVYACQNVLERVPERFRNRLLVTPTDYDQNEVKWVISKCDWFCGTRMHATIAGLSTFTPTATVSYSDKALGVFESCGQGGEVFDPREMDNSSVVTAMIKSYQRRNELRASLEDNIPRVKAIAERQMDEIVEVIEKCVTDQRVGRSA